ncbi:hypothetical protein [Haladaptatus sp. R4]|nr:hypothetical protein [Haladaptatus sp. R4]
MADVLEQIDRHLNAADFTDDPENAAYHVRCARQLVWGLTGGPQ